MKAPWKFLRYLPMARRIITAGRLPVLLIAVARKRSSRGGMVGSLRDDLRLFQALGVAWWRGEYRAISGQAFLSVVAAMLYFVMPLDAIPDFIPGLGLVDDLAVLGWVMRKWSGELEAFRAWRDAQPVEVQTDLERVPERDEAKA